MYFPFISERSTKRQLYRRKGGGGKGGGSSGGGKSSGSSGTSGTAGRSSSVSSGGTSRSATSYGAGGGKQVAIPAGQPFAGRLSGGGTRDQVYGNQQYGSGYPGVAGRGVAGRGFPFVFWPLAWGGVAGVGTAAYLHTNEYGRPDNSSRPGGVMMTAAFPSSSGNTTFRVVSDNTTVTSLIQDIAANCSTVVKDSSSITPSAYNDSSPDPPKPEQSVQYYRASSVSLTLDGYNNTGALGDDNTPDTPLPSNIDRNLLDCLNSTIGDAVPLIDSGVSVGMLASPSGVIGFAWVIWCLTSLV
ncbi:hypothetical protein BDQ12DRAFT_650289 [Crucibulum laeve]|uniref:Uncharacterized protein n=1 Tax=Crucibulum laeve TaxID=68775 RepID=A0A5C3M4A3_9AGAR|nr:hypothetical protein BDQ12DRAFT_650289 [Crucibulum laeve]